MKKHLHKYARTFLDDDKNCKILRCMVPGCRHYIRLKLALNAVAECWRCSKPFVLSRTSLTLAKPHCDECVVKKDKTDIARIEDKLKELGI